MNMVNSKRNHYIIELSNLGDDRGSLTVIEVEKHIPFRIQRIFYEYNTAPFASRGNHANINSKFGFVSITGSCTVIVDDGNTKIEYLLDSPLKLLFVDKMIWKEMKDFSLDNVLLVLSDQKYDSNEYINDYNEFIKNVKLRKWNYEGNYFSRW